MVHIMSIAPPLIIDGIFLLLLRQTVAKHGCNGCLEVDRNLNIYAPPVKLRCENCRLPAIVVDLARFTTGLSIEIMGTCKGFLNRNEIYAPEIINPHLKEIKKSA